VEGFEPTRALAHGSFFGFYFFSKANEPVILSERAPAREAKDLLLARSLMRHHPIRLRRAMRQREHGPTTPTDVQLQDDMGPIAGHAPGSFSPP